MGNHGEWRVTKVHDSKQVSEFTLKSLQVSRVFVTVIYLSNYSITCSRNITYFNILFFRLLCVNSITIHAAGATILPMGFKASMNMD